MRVVVESKKPAWIALACALVFHTLLLSIQTNSRFDTSIVRTVLLDSLAPMEKLVDLTYDGVGNIWQGYFALIGVHDENESLRAEIDTLRMELARRDEEVREAGRLRQLTDLQSAAVGKVVVARVIGRDPTQLHQTVTIDKGQVHGVRPDTAVMTPDGVVGRVIAASNLFAIVQLITDAQSAVGIVVESSRRQGIVKGIGGRELELDYIDDDNDIKEGDELITSGMDRIHPKGIPLGVVTSVGERRGLIKAVTIRPYADLGRLEEVLCIVEHPLEIPDPSEMPPAASSSTSN